MLAAPPPSWTSQDVVYELVTSETEHFGLGEEVLFH